MGRLLITAFEPFGLIGKHIRRKNRSQTILESIMAQQPDSHDYLIMPASDDGITLLRQTLERLKPAGVISLGENLTSPQSEKVEPFAYDIKASALPDLSLAFRKKMGSAFAQSIAPNAKSTIGNFYCNQAYLQALKWAAQNGNPPVVFIHTPTFGDYNKHTAQVLQTAEQMKKYSGFIPEAVPD